VPGVPAAFDQRVAPEVPQCGEQDVHGQFVPVLQVAAQGFEVSRVDEQRDSPTPEAGSGQRGQIAGPQQPLQLLERRVAQVVDEDVVGRPGEPVGPKVLD
jgi:hypothetical protein